MSPKPSEIEKLSDKFDAFLIQYELDMRGDKSLSDGNKGVIGEIREIKKMNSTYPSITFLLVKHPIKTISSICGAFVVLYILVTTGAIKVVAPLFGITIP